MRCPRCKTDIPEAPGHCPRCGLRPESEKRHADLLSRRRKFRLVVVASVIIIAVTLILAYSLVAGWWSVKPDQSKVFITDFYFDVSGVSECTATLRYMVHNDNPVSAATQIKYYDNGSEVGSDFYIVGANKFRQVSYQIEYVDCLANHSYEARIVAVS